MLDSKVVYKKSSTLRLSFVEVDDAYVCDEPVTYSVVTSPLFHSSEDRDF
jgi:hypothetical protein